MKKLFLTIGLVLAAGILFTAQSPSLDGRALVADPGVFPKGLFAKTVGYLPGDTISVTNPANAERVDILVIGSLDPSEGVAIMLSPEAANALNIKKNSNNLVKLTKRNGNVDEVANGSAVIATSATAPVEEAAPAVEEAAEEKPLSQVIEEAIANGESVEDAEQEAIAAAEEKVADKLFDETDKAIEAEEEIAAAEEAALEGAAEDAVVEEAIVVAPVPEEGEVAAEEEGEEPQENYPEYEAVEDELAGEVEEAEEEFVEAEVKDDIPEADVSEELAESEVVEDEGIVETPVPEAVEDEYEAIVLVPSESKSPESSLVDEPLIVEEKEDELVIDSSASVSGVAYISDFSQLASQKYYVQIAVYKSSENVEQIASQYGSRYPITVVQQGSKSPVLIGPLTVDEYGVVLERFKSYGFKDAFIKVGK